MMELCYFIVSYCTLLLLPRVTYYRSQDKWATLGIAGVCPGVLTHERYSRLECGVPEHEKLCTPRGSQHSQNNAVLVSEAASTDGMSLSYSKRF